MSRLVDNIYQEGEPGPGPTKPLPSRSELELYVIPLHNASAGKTENCERPTIEDVRIPRANGEGSVPIFSFLLKKRTVLYKGKQDDPNRIPQRPKSRSDSRPDYDDRSKRLRSDHNYKSDRREEDRRTGNRHDRRFDRSENETETRRHTGTDRDRERDRERERASQAVRRESGTRRDDDQPERRPRNAEEEDSKETRTIKIKTEEEARRKPSSSGQNGAAPVPFVPRPPMRYPMGPPIRAAPPPFWPMPPRFPPFRPYHNFPPRPRF